MRKSGTSCNPAAFQTLLLLCVRFCTPRYVPLSFPRTFKPFGKEQLLTNLYKIRGGKGAEFCSGENSEGGCGRYWRVRGEQTRGTVSVCQLKDTLVRSVKSCIWKRGALEGLGELAFRVTETKIQPLVLRSWRTCQGKRVVPVVVTVPGSRLVAPFGPESP